MSCWLKIELPHQLATAPTLALARLWVCGLWLFVLGQDFAFHAELPRELFRPRGLLTLVPSSAWNLILSNGGLHTLHALCLAGVVCVALGLDWRRLVFATTLLLLTLFSGIPRSYTNMFHHAELTLLLVSFVLMCSPCYDAWTVRPQRRPNRRLSAFGATLVAMAAVVLVPYSLVAVVRFAHGGLEMIFSEEMRFLFAQRALQGLPEGWQLGLMLSQHPELNTLFQLGFLGVTLLELAAPLALVLPSVRRAWLVAMVLFHVSTWFGMGIIFTENLLLYPLLLLDHSAWQWRPNMERRNGLFGYRLAKTYQKAAVPSLHG